MSSFKSILIYFFVISSLVIQNSIAQTKISNIDFNYLYNDANGVTGEINCSVEDSIALLLVKIDSSLDSLKKYHISYSVANSLEDEISTRVNLAPIGSYFQYEDKTSSYFGLRAKIPQSRYIILWFSDTLEHRRYSLIKEIPYGNRSEDLVMYRKEFNSPILSAYVKEGTQLRINTLNRANKDVIVNYYDHHFLPAKPPMARIAAGDSITFSRDAFFEIKSNDTITFADKGLYHFSIKELEQGQSVVVTHPQYPGAASFDDLVENLRYLATEEEYLKMTTSFEKKELFDKFWLNNTKSEDKAKAAVKEYYNRVKTANKYFTSYKEGWKTDRGMLYIIFGPPTRVFLKDKTEMWIYEKTFELPRIAFTFNQIDTAFTDKHYVLVRKPEYQNLWFRVVDLWRKGKKEY